MGPKEGVRRTEFRSGGKSGQERGSHGRDEGENLYCRGRTVGDVPLHGRNTVLSKVEGPH